MEEKFNLEFRLNQKQMDFCKEYLSNGGIARRAYSKVYGTSPAVSSTNGAALLRKSDVQKYLIKLQEKIQSKGLLDLEDVVKKLITLEEDARQNKKLDVALDCLKVMANICAPKSKDSSSSGSNSITIQILPPNNNNSNKFIDITHTETKGELPPTTITVSSNETSMGDTDINISPTTTSSNVGDTDDDELPFKD